jgi:hypothetical protein
MLAPNGTCVDLSKIAAIDITERLPSDFKITFGFKVYFNPEGVPFNKDNCFCIIISKSYDKPKDICALMKDVATQSSAYESFSEFVKECRIDWESHRLEFINDWKKYKGE